LYIGLSSCKAAFADGIVLENRTYSPLHCRYRTATSAYSNWRAILPGESCGYAGSARLHFEIWFDKDRTEEFDLVEGSIYALERPSGRAPAQFVRVDAPYRPAPAVPGDRGEFRAPRRLAGTTWSGKENARGISPLEFRFEEDGRVSLNDSRSTWWGQCHCAKNSITLRFDGLGRAYTGTIVGREMYGKTGYSDWTATCQTSAPLFGTIKPKNKFGPLETFIAECEEIKHPYRLSLKKLAEDCAEAQKNGALPDELRFMRGFTLFFGYYVEAKEQDVVLIGVKDPTRPPIDVDSFVAAIKASHSGLEPLCSLDADEDYLFSKSRVSGVPWNTRFAEVMIFADHDMGQIARGFLHPNISGFKSANEQFADILGAFGLEGEVESKGGSAYTENRWWFNFDSSIARSVVDESGTLVYLYANPIRLSTEQNVGGAYGTGKSTLSNRRFVDAFVTHMDRLGMHYPNIAELQGTFRLYDLLRHMRTLSATSVPRMDYWTTTYQHPYSGPPARFRKEETKRKIKVRKTDGTFETQTWVSPVKPNKVEKTFAVLDVHDRVSEGRYDRVRTGSFCKHFSVYLEKDKSYLVDLMSGELDPYLRLEDPSGRQVAFDDDGGEGLNSRLRFTPHFSGSYRVVATTYAANRTGSIHLKVGRILSGTDNPSTGELVSNLNDRLAVGAFDRIRTDSYCKLFSIRFERGQTYTIDLTSLDFDPYLRLEDDSGRILDQDDDGGEGLNSRIRFTAPASGTYHLVATSFGSRQTGAFQLAVHRAK